MSFYFLKRTYLKGFLLLTLAFLSGAVLFPSWASDVLPVGIKAPAFNLPATGNQTISLSQYQGNKKLILVFYPGDNTPGCTIQLCALRDHYDVVKALNGEVLASNPASVKSHENFAQRQHYLFPILSDADHTMAKAYGVDGLFGFNRRTVYIIDKKGVVQFAERGMPTVEKILSVLRKI